MASSYQEIDRDGDLILILSPSLLVFKEAVRGARGEGTVTNTETSQKGDGRQRNPGILRA